MKIARIIYDWPPPWSGLAPHPYEITVSQAAEGHEVTVFCGRWPNAGEMESPPGVSLVPIWREPFQGALTVTSSVTLLFKYLKWRKSNTPDILHAHGHFGIWIFLYRLFLRKFLPWSKELKIPLVAHFHNTAQGRWNILKEAGKITNPLSEKFVYPMEVLANKLAIKAAAANIFVSQSNLEEAKKFYNADPEKCFVVESGINTEIFCPIGDEEKEKSRRDLGLDVYDKVIVNRGVMVRRKNPHLLVEALAYLPKSYKLLLSGPGDEKYLDEIIELVSNLKVEDRVLMTGYTPYREGPIAYQVSDLFVLPSEWEGLPKVVLEALSCGKPVLASGFKFSEEIAGLHYLDNLDPKYIAQRIQELTESREEVDFTKIGHIASWAVRVQQIEKVYDYAKEHYL